MEDAAGIEPATAMTNATDAKPVARRAKAGAQQSELPTFEELSQYFHLPTKKACEELGVGLVVLKRACRRFGLLRWPYRRPRTTVQEQSPDGSSGTDAEANQEGPSSATAVAAAAAQRGAQQQLFSTATPEVFKPVPLREARTLLQAACTLSQQQQQQQQPLPHLQSTLAAQSPRGACHVGNPAGGAAGGQRGYAWRSPLTAEILGMGLQPPAALAQHAQHGQVASALQDIVSAAAAAGLRGSREPFAGLPQLESVFRQLPQQQQQQQPQQQQHYGSIRPYSQQQAAMPPQLTWPLASLQYQQHQLRHLQQQHQQQAMAQPRMLVDAPSLPPSDSQQKMLLHLQQQEQHPFSLQHQQQQQLSHSMAATLPSPRSPPAQAAQQLPASLLDQQVLMQLATQLVEVPGLAGQLAAAMAVVLQEKCSAAVSSGRAGSGSAVTGAGPVGGAGSPSHP